MNSDLYIEIKLKIITVIEHNNTLDNFSVIIVELYQAEHVLLDT